jgi:hypothetical protein
MARHIVGLTPLATASRAELIAALAPVFDHDFTISSTQAEQAGTGAWWHRRQARASTRRPRRP